MGKISSFFTISFILAYVAILVIARDPELVADFIVRPDMNPETITGQYFTYTGLRPLGNINFTRPTSAFIKKVTNKEFPTLEGQGVSCDVIIYPPGGESMPHFHPRAAEMLLVVQGSLNVGFVDSDNKLYTQILKTLDLFVFPRGLLHYQVNAQDGAPTVAVAMYGGTNAGTVSVVKTLFGSGMMDAEMMAKAFKTDADTTAKLINDANNN